LKALVLDRLRRFPVEHHEGTVEMLSKHGFKPEFKESSGGHTGSTGGVLDVFTPLLFQ